MLTGMRLSRKSLIQYLGLDLFTNRKLRAHADGKV